MGPSRASRLALGAALVLTLAIAPSVQAAGPDHSKVGTWSLTLDAGVVCDFAVQWDVDATNTNQLVFPVQADGDQVVRSAGRGYATVTNLDTDESIVVMGGYRQDLVFHEDGTFDIYINGTVLAGYFPTDVGGPSMWWLKGHLHDEADSAFTAVGHDFVGNATDLCAALS
jgi:hypothetical protein